MFWWMWVCWVFGSKVPETLLKCPPLTWPGYACPVNPWFGNACPPNAWPPNPWLPKPWFWNWPWNAWFGNAWPANAWFGNPWLLPTNPWLVPVNAWLLPALSSGPKRSCLWKLKFRKNSENMEMTSFSLTTNLAGCYWSCCCQCCCCY